ncbi:hypothetical protein ScPMuIL_014683 [Solemya velum]
MDTSYLEGLRRELTNHQDHMHPGYYFVGDNVDLVTNVRHISQVRRNQSKHLYQICAYKYRVTGNHLSNTGPIGDNSKEPFGNFIPNAEDQERLIDHFTIIVAWHWTSHIWLLSEFAKHLPKHTKHKHMREMQEKTRWYVNLGVVRKNEQYNDQMTDICEFMHKDVPGHSVDDANSHPVNTLSGGDYLTFEKHKQAQLGKLNSRTPSKRLERLIAKMEEFHNQAELVQLIWKLLYNDDSSQDVGTLHAAKNMLGATNVSSDPHGHYYAASFLMDKFGAAYIVAGGLHHFKLKSPDDDTWGEEPGDMTEEAKGEYIQQKARKFVEQYCMPSVLHFDDLAPLSNDFVCRYCVNSYKRPKCLQRHETATHGHSDAIHSEHVPESKTTETNSVFNYTRLFMVLSLLRLNHNDVIQMGDGERIMLVNRYLYLFYKKVGFVKYAVGLLESLAQTQVLLSPRMAYRLLWNRTVNHQGKAGCNHPNHPRTL